MTNDYQNVYVPYLEIDTGVGFKQKIEGQISWAFDLEKCEAWLERNKNYYADRCTIISVGYELKQVVPQTLNSEYHVFKTLPSHAEYVKIHAVK